MSGSTKSGSSAFPLIRSTPLSVRSTLVQFFVYYEVQRICHFVHAFVVLLHVDFLGLQHAGLDALFAQGT